MAVRRYRINKEKLYTFTNMQNPEEEKIYEYNALEILDKKLVISVDNIIEIGGVLNDFEVKEYEGIKMLCKIYKKLSLIERSVSIEDSENTLFKLYDDAKEYITHLYLCFHDCKFLTKLNNLDNNLELLLIDCFQNNLDLSSFENFPSSLKTFIIKCDFEYIVLPKNFNYGLETFVLDNINVLPMLSNLPPTIKNLVIKFNKETTSHGELEYNNRDFIEDLAGIPHSLENLVYKVQGNITNIDFTILPKTMKSIDISCCGIGSKTSIKEEYKKMEMQLKEHAPECLIKYEWIISY